MREDWAHAGGALEQVVLLPPHGAGPDGFAQVIVQIRETTLQPRDVRLDVGLNRARALPRRFFSAVSMSSSCRRRASWALSAWVWVSGKGRCAGRTASAKWARPWASKASVLANRPVALAIPGLAGIDHHDGQPCGAQGSGDGHFETTGGFQDNEDRLEVPQPGHQGGDAGVIIRHAPPSAVGRSAISKCALATSIPTNMEP